MKKLIVTMVVLVGLVSGCGSLMTPTVYRIPFPVEEYEALRPRFGTGTAIVRGQAFMRTMIGEVRYAAGSPVVITPVTSYSRQEVDLVGNFDFHDYVFEGPCYPNFVPAEPDSRIKEFMAGTTADGEGRFEFKHVPYGDYYLLTEVKWYVPSGQYHRSIQGGRITKQISVKDGQEYNIILTR